VNIVNEIAATARLWIPLTSIVFDSGYIKKKENEKIWCSCLQETREKHTDALVVSFRCYCVVAVMSCRCVYTRIHTNILEREREKQIPQERKKERE
jgi:hypothetical protein